MPFFSDPSLEPKRSNRFEFHIAGLAPMVISSVDKPKPQTSTVKHSYKQHTFKWPGKVEWQDINVTIIDPVDPDTTKALSNILVESGYLAPTSEKNASIFMSKKKVVTAIGVPRILQVNADGESIEEWKLHNAFITNTNFGSLDYNTDDLVKLQLTLSYDYATIEGTKLKG